MLDWLYEAIPEPDDLRIWALLLRLLLAMVMGGGVALIYRLTQRSDAPDSSSFIATLVLLCILIAMVTEIIGKNIARAFSLVGALSIIRFRTVVEDTRDTAFVIFAVIVGMALGSDMPLVAVLGMVVVGFAAGLLSLLPRASARESSEWTLQLRVAAGINAAPWESILTEHCQDAQLVGTATARQGAALEFTYKLKLKRTASPTLLVGALNRIEGIQNLEVRRS